MRRRKSRAGRAISPGMMQMAMLASAVLVTGLEAGLMPAATAGARMAPATSTTPTDFHAWTSLAGFTAGRLQGGATLTGRGGGALALRPGASAGSWTSPVHQTEFAVTELVSSWQAATPGDSWITTQLSVEVGHRWSPWFTMGKWAFTTAAIQRTSVPNQNNPFGYISIDTYFAHTGESAAAYRLRERLHGSRTSRPTVGEVGAVAFAPERPTYHPSRTTMRRTVDLHVPQYSQETHHGEYARFGGGGEAWCSPTSSEMVVEYYGRGPTAKQIGSLPPNRVFDRHRRKDGTVDWAAIHTYDSNYGGTGNWPFNTAYASHYGLHGSVRQYDSLVPLEYWIRRGVPAVVSIAWNNKSKNPRMHLDGADIDSTGGHLIVVRGFTANGDVIANDPASPDNAAVRHIYQRQQFEYLWLHASAGVVYLIRP